MAAPKPSTARMAPRIVKGLELRPAATPENLYCLGFPGIATFLSLRAPSTWSWACGIAGRNRAESDNGPTPDFWREGVIRSVGNGVVQERGVPSRPGGSGAGRAGHLDVDIDVPAGRLDGLRPALQRPAGHLECGSCRCALAH